MNKLKYVSSDTVKKIDGYISRDNYWGLLLTGPPGLGKRRAALHIAKELLNTDDIYDHPDFFLLDESSIKVDMVEELLDKSYRNSIGAFKIFIVNHAHTMTAAAQSRFLKLIEDKGHKNVIIFTVDQDNMLDTIKSRCHTISFHSLPTAEMKKILLEDKQATQELDFLCFLFNNAPYLYKDNISIIDDFINLKNTLFKINQRAALLNIFGLLKEKDSNSFWEKHKMHKDFLIRLVSYPFYQLILDRQPENVYPGTLYSKEKAIDIIQEAYRHLKRSKYKINDFFDLLRFVIHH